MPAIVISGTHSGVGKTTVSLALCAALRRRGMSVQAFKVGPDFIDAAHLSVISGAPCRNLDGWMFSREANRERFHRALRDFDFVVIEGVMGLFDGADADSESGSTAQMAKWLASPEAATTGGPGTEAATEPRTSSAELRRASLPIVLVADASAIARSIAALVYGFRNFDPQLNVAGVVLNRVGGAGHIRYLASALAGAEGEVLGACPREDEIHIPERHLGLHMPGSGGADLALADRLARYAEEHLQIDRILTIAAADGMAAAAPAIEAGAGLMEPATATTLNPRDRSGRRGTGARPVRIAVARDDAFCFYYPENLELLTAAGADLVFFSPLESVGLPEGIRGLYIGGGYPELHAARLASNHGLLDAIGRFAAGGGFIYGECGGLMLVSRYIETTDGLRHAMAGLLPIGVRMHRRLRAIGYREVEVVGLKPAAAAPAERSAAGRAEASAGGLETASVAQQRVRENRLIARGHEFHYSEAIPVEISATAAAVGSAHLVLAGGTEKPEGFRIGSVVASYIHLHFSSNPELAPALIAAASQAG
jgi:cobyrinic acid a,c-diamide synthase